MYADICKQMLTVASACTVYALRNVLGVLRNVPEVLHNVPAVSNVILLQLKPYKLLKKKFIDPMTLTFDLWPWNSRST